MFNFKCKATTTRGAGKIGHMCGAQKDIGATLRRAEYEVEKVVRSTIYCSTWVFWGKRDIWQSFQIELQSGLWEYEPFKNIIYFYPHTESQYICRIEILVQHDPTKFGKFDFAFQNIQKKRGQ